MCVIPRKETLEEGENKLIEMLNKTLGDLDGEKCKQLVLFRHANSHKCVRIWSYLKQVAYMFKLVLLWVLPLIGPSLVFLEFKHVHLVKSVQGI